LLHDTIEDTETSPEDIQREFGEEVLSLVLEVTDDKNLEKAERKRLQIEEAPIKSTGAKLIKLADKSCNVHDLIDSPPKYWSFSRRREYLLWTEQVVAGLAGTNPNLEAYYEKELISGKTLLGL
jgi:guanosine-3',5'-bis(diphosphate) 3'-pyrophosphohydrolase